MEKKTQPGRATHAADARRTAQTAAARGASRPAGANRTAGAHQAAGAHRARTASGAVGSGRSAAPRTSSRPAAGANRAAATRRGSPAKRRPQPRRRGGAKLNLRDRRLWLIALACAIVIVLAVVLALTLPRGGGKDASVPTSAGVGSESPVDEIVIDDTVGGEPELFDSPVDFVEGAEAPEGDASSAADNSDITAQLSPELIAMMEKYQVLDGIPNTAQPLGIAESARVDDAYFDDALFVGDSVTLKLQEYVIYTRKHGEPNLMGGARFLAAQSFSARNALMKVSSKSIHPVIGGDKMTLEDAVAKLAPKKLYIMLGMNDVGISGIDDALKNMGKLLERIREKNPDVKIIVESATPRYTGTHPSTNQLFAFDVRLYDAILNLNDPSIQFLDVAYTMRDAQGMLPKEYCFDPDGMGIHFTNSGCRRWIDYLYTHASV